MMNIKIRCLGMLASVLLLGMTISGASIVSAEAKFDDYICKLMYERYKELGEQKFREKYTSKSFASECVNLYKDPHWYFVGKNKIDKNYEKINLLLKDTEGKKVSVKILSSMSLGKENFLVKFRACTEKSIIAKPSFLVKSPIEQYVALSGKSIPTGKCNDYNIPVKTKQTSAVQIEYVSDLSKYQNIRSKTI